MAEKITLVDGELRVPDDPIIPFIEGDGTGVDIWPAVAARARRRRDEARQDDRVERGARRAEGVRRDGRAGCPRRPSSRSATT